MILEDMKNTTLRPPIMWIEWYFSFKFVDEKIKLLEVTIKPRPLHNFSLGFPFDFVIQY